MIALDSIFGIFSSLSCALLREQLPLLFFAFSCTRFNLINFSMQSMLQEALKLSFFFNFALRENLFKLYETLLNIHLEQMLKFNIFIHSQLLINSFWTTWETRCCMRATTYRKRMKIFVAWNEKNWSAFYFSHLKIWHKIFRIRTIKLYKTIKCGQNEILKFLQTFILVHLSLSLRKAKHLQWNEIKLSAMCFAFIKNHN